MLSIVWFLAWGTLFQQSQPSEGTQDALSLYRQAAASLQSENPCDAIPTLQKLVNTYADSKLATLAAVRLAECYLATDRFPDALKLLLTWTPRVLDLHELDVARRLQPNIMERATELTKSALAQLPEEYTGLLEQLEEEHRLLSKLDSGTAQSFELQPVSGWLLAELARRYAAQKRYDESYELLRRLGQLADSREQKLREFDLPLQILLTRPTAEMIEAMSRSLEGSSTWSTAESFSARLAIAEAHRRLGKLEESSIALERIACWLNEEIRSNANAQTLGIVNWKVSIELRRAELMILQGRNKQAAQLAELCLKDYSDYPDPALFRLLAARSLIAEIEFDAAKEHLQRIADDPASKPAQVAEAFWTHGEICFLQRNYASAIQQYQRVVDVANQSTWHARALIQMAKCYELNSAPLDAMATYQIVVTKYPLSDVAESARARFEQLTNWRENRATPVAIQSSESKLPVQR